MVYTPVSVAEFAKAFLSIWRPQGQSCRLALGISGGVDSMALAYLVKQLPPEFGFQPIAFIVDHQIRPESSKEAQKVADWLAREEPEILTTSVPNTGKGPNPKIETYARKARYQALGRACGHHGSDRLMLAHHQDDRIESMLMNIISGRLTRRPMNSVAGIPECEGLHGVYESGGRTPSDARFKMWESRRWFVSPARDCETGGVQILRPLLSFPKGRLRATCEANGVPWVEDSTNHDPTYTVRNTVRHLLKSERLPLALQPKSIAGHIDRLVKRYSQIDREVESLLEQCKMKFEPRIGSLRVQFPPDEIMCNSAGQHLVRKILSMVSPLHKVELAQIRNAMSSLFPWFTSSNDAEIAAATPIRSFTTSGVLVSAASPLPHWDIHRSAYLFTREKPPSTSSAPLMLIPPVDPDHDAGPVHTQWTLWDGRYWIKVKNPLTEPLVIRPLYEEELGDLYRYSGLRGPDIEKLKRLIKSVVHKRGWHSLPVIAQVSNPHAIIAHRKLLTHLNAHPGSQEYNWAPGKNGCADVIDATVKNKCIDARCSVTIERDRGRVVALPSLGWVNARFMTRGLRWDIRYKKLDPWLESRLAVEKLMGKS
ncbi:hypothetical protein EJ05DRAFT_179609 [Pseudovirgaria hyperparasitica]|uniref:tRNA(Ile)-lysidine synthetase n=1 Tax=Pseudovirgaria hyperparasitica TaxID=470096 RepID=A0A6A6WHU6_9PEZI|nr:uncharacterized protein EJ05DRAFT_179609 [Pseudovirgaria hyperparasitica]KAF2761654.1 hypothetical protein EJ05DRAFT_179609 [Pseudovirgaria hyperparasitica]